MKEMTVTDPVISEEERRKKSVYYESCTSTFKDDLPTLVTCLRSDKGEPHTKQEAGFLLWHHALQGDQLQPLLAAGVLPACVANLDTPPAGLLPAERACSAGILLTLVAGNDDVSEQLVRCRAPSGRPSLEVLHGHLRDGAAMARHYCCRLLHLLAKQIPSVMLRSMDNHLPYMPAYLSVWGVRDHGDAPVVTAVSCMVATLLNERPELAEAVVAGGGVEELLGVLRHHKSEAACAGALTLLLKLLAVEGAAGQLIGLGGVPVLIDIIGPPPRVWPPPETEAPELPAPAAAAAASQQQPVTEPHGHDDGGGGGAGSGDRRVSVVGPDGRASMVAEAGTPGAVDGVSPSKQAAKVSVGGSGGGSANSSPNATARGRLPSGGSGNILQTDASTSSVGSAVRVPLPLTIPGIHSAASGARSGSSSPPRNARSVAPSLGGETSSASLAGMTAQASSASAFSAGRSSWAGTTASASASGAASGHYLHGGEALATLPAPAPPPPDLASNHCGLRWILLPGWEVASLAVACLTSMVQRPECLAEVEYRLASHRILAQLKTVMAAGAAAAGGGKKSKKKGLGLTAEQTTGLARLLGLLKFLSLTNTTRFRVARLGAIPSLVKLYDGGSDYLLRNHCQAILSNVALLAENGPTLKEGKTPEEFLVGNPMRLTAQERAVLRWEFPDDPALPV